MPCGTDAVKPPVVFSSPPAASSELNPEVIRQRIREWGHELGFQQVAITDADPGSHRDHLQAWLAAGYHGEMAWMEQRAPLRSDPDKLYPGVRRVIVARMDYRPPGVDPSAVLADPERAYIARYSLGRDYHKLMRKRLTRLAARIAEELAPHRYRAFVDSAPVLERGFAERAGLGWIGKNTMLLNRHAGSLFFLGEIYTDLELPVDLPQERGHCGSCRACLDLCPTQAFVGPHQLDARRCISYLTIEFRGSIPLALRPLMGNRIFGCDDCQLVCPWNRFAQPTEESDFHPRHGLDNAQLVTLFAWTEEEYLQRTEGSALRRIGHECWLRNLAVALGNAPYHEDIKAALQTRRDHPSELVREHVAWALEQQQQRCDQLIARSR